MPAPTTAMVIGAGMLKRIDISQIEMGMFIHKMEGSWFNHPFWRGRFLIEDAEQLARLRDSELPGVIIDTSRGYHHDEAPLPPVAPMIRERHIPLRQPRAASRRADAAHGTAGKSFDHASTAPQTTAREFGHATRIAGRAQKVVSRVFLEARLGKSINCEVIEPVIEDIFASVQRNPHAFNGLMRCKRDNEYVYRHALAVSALMISLGRQMKLPPEELRQAGTAGLLIDVGVGHLPVDLADYGGDYRQLPASILQGHVQLGHDFLTAGGIPEAVARTCLEHHERLDGSGYPQGLSGDAISLFARMAAICDSYDNLANDSNGTSGLNPAAALQHLAQMPGMDPALLTLFTQAMGIYPIGSVVLLRSGRLAMVVDQSPCDFTRPRVRAFYSVTSGRMIAPANIDLANCQGEDALEGLASPDDYNISHFPELRTRLFASVAQ